MEYEDSEYNSYEDDFETPDPSELKQSVKVSREQNNAANLNYSFKDLSYKKSYKSSEITKSSHRPTSTLKPPKKTYQSLLQENKDLRSNLRQLSEELSQILASLSRKSRSPKKPYSNGDPLSSRLQIYINEYIVLQNKVNKITNPDYLINLRTEIKEKELKITSIEKLLKELKKKQKNRDKNLEKFWVDDFVPNELTTFGHMNDQLFQYREQIEKIEAQYKKDLENYEKLQEKEQELNEKVEKLEEIWDHYISQSEETSKNQILRNQFESLNKQLESVRIRANNRMSKLQTQEKTLAFEIETFKKDSKSIELQIEIKEKEAAQISIELQNVASRVSEYDMGHLLSLVKIQANKSDSTAGSAQGKSPPPEIRKKKNFEELFKDETKNKKNEENEGKKIPFSIKNDEKEEKNKENDKNFSKIMKGNNPKKKNEDVIEENLPEEEESFQPQLKKNSTLNQPEANQKIIEFVKPLEKSSLLKELELSEASNKFNPPQTKGKSLLEELEESSANDRFQNSKIEGKKPEKPSFFTELDSKNQEKPSRPIEKSSFLSELEKDSKTQEKPFRPIEKSSFFTDLEKNDEKSFRPIEKSSFFEDLEKPPNEKPFKPIEKSSFFQELESGVEKHFKPVEKSSIFDELSSKPLEKSSDIFKPIQKSSFLNDLSLNNEKDPESFFKPNQKSSFFDQFDSSPKKVLEKPTKNEENPFMSETEPKTNPLTKPRGRDRSHLFSKKEENSFNNDSTSQKYNFLSPEKKPEEITDLLLKGKTENEKPGYLTGEILDKMKSMAERAEKHDFFGNFYDQNEEISFTKKLLPTKFESTQVKPPANPSKPKTSFFELVEEDINL